MAITYAVEKDELLMRIDELCQHVLHCRKCPERDSCYTLAGMKEELKDKLEILQCL